MAMWSALVLLAAASTSVYADVVQTAAAFPEIAREIGSSRIVSGWEAEDDQFPYQLSLRMVAPNGAVTSCGGSIIHSEWGLTAAHCTAGRVSVVLRAGVVNLTRPGVIFETTKYYNHPLYNEAIPSFVQPNDIGLLEFGRALEFNSNVQPIRIQRSASSNKNYDGLRLTASGWGRTWTNEAAPENLNWVYLRGVPNQVCWLIYGGIVQDSTICASGYNVTSQSTCQGDSGGPLSVIDEDGLVSMVGVTSFVSGTGCHTDFPAGFIRPGHYHAWFTQLTGVDFDWELETTTVDPNPTTTATPEEETTTESTTAAVPEEETTTESTTAAVPEEETTTTALPETTVTDSETEEPECEDENEDEDEDEETRVHFVN